MPYDLFISYSRRNNERRQVTALKAQIESAFRAFAGGDSQVFLAVLSPHYLASPYCRWEWEDYVPFGVPRLLGQGVCTFPRIWPTKAGTPNNSI